MEATRQDAWTKDEDVILAETVIHYIRNGQTQLEAFKDVAKQLSRTSAACGFRWNATIRKYYQEAIEFAKEERKHAGRRKTWNFTESADNNQKDPIGTAISLLEKMKQEYLPGNHPDQKKQAETIEYLKKENDDLKAKLLRYQGAWKEINSLWDWVNREPEKKEDS